MAKTANASVTQIGKVISVQYMRVLKIVVVYMEHVHFILEIVYAIKGGVKTVMENVQCHQYAILKTGADNMEHVCQMTKIQHIHANVTRGGKELANLENAQTELIHVTVTILNKIRYVKMANAKMMVLIVYVNVILDINLQPVDQHVFRAAVV
jgi:hypothetical protein